ncbi:MAG: nucleotidyltransferase family protein [Gammaproteobacteria bacterium]|nr:nucleotidyltransferase family protein [Gammaproteobacteria bacterium]MBU0788289.1 nucleotidyltransferase family protein [Gammaproteobacteria bacterium]MBU0815214.1 nucleotidyltransferase family protein [Gammaproteobacteria bacterium]MBU1785678.1 nucleotidyltransferase family protein [Gammaproteobacteria bacterium]
MSDARSKIQIPLNDSWRHAILPSDATIQQTIGNLNEVAIQIVLVVNEIGELVGTISDGDIRRGLLKGMGLSSPIRDIVKHTPLVVPPGLERDLVMQLMAANKVRQIPIVDERNVVIGLHLWDDIMSPRVRENVMVIMAGGLGTRLRPHTETCPKPMLPLAGKPMLEHIIERARLEGFHRFILAIHYLGHMIEEYFGDGSDLNVRIDYLREDAPLGTAGALSLLYPLPGLPFVVTNGDVITDIRYGELLDFHGRQDAAATMAVRQYEWQHPFGVVQMRGIEIVGFEEKPISRTHINAGVYALDPNALSALKSSAHCDMPTLFERLQASGRRTVAYPMHEPWLDVGRPGDLLTANQIIAEHGKVSR